LFLAGSPQTHSQDQDVEDHDGDDTRDVDHLGGLLDNCAKQM
jgi:hypothetical protein